MKRIILSAISFLGMCLTMIYLVACGTNKSTNTPTVNPYANNNGCPAGSTYTGGFCYNQNGYYNGYNSSINFVTDNFSYKTFTVSNSSAFKNFIKKAMGTCDRAANSGGIYSCDSWVSGQFQLTVQVNQTQTQALRATFAAYPAVSNYYWYGYSLPSASDFFYGMFGFPVYYDTGVVKNPLAVDMVVSPINDSKGFEARAYGDNLTEANRSLIQLQVFTGTIQDATLNYQLGFEGEVFAKGKLQRY
ncbi:MAG: hypothetical protein L6Q37_15200 [Bdellovibrionaceae bacterium]|nr:hypothetical protein [Pseudobdellovibrionaceae bacterium]NUM60249.1 hypothetical protein [Pseudobdellovibrionaceae bacterium]